MDRKQFLEFVSENFNVSGESIRLINNILSYVEDNIFEENEQYNALCSLLDGTIGLTDNEIKKIIL